MTKTITSSNIKNAPTTIKKNRLHAAYLLTEYRLESYGYSEV